MYQDFHAHTYYSACGADEPEALVLRAIAAGIEVFGITDHNYGIGERKRAYFDQLTALREKYRGQIHLYRGIEIATVQNLCIRPEEDISYFDYCLIEHLDRPDSCVGGDGLLAFVKRCGCPAGIAHTDLFAYLKKRELEPIAFFSLLAENDIFWELNVNYDSVHGYREHPYVKHFIEDPVQQQIIKKSGVRLSVGFDGHRLGEYQEERVKRMCQFIENLGIPFFLP